MCSWLKLAILFSFSAQHQFKLSLKTPQRRKTDLGRAYAYVRNLEKIFMILRGRSKGGYSEFEMRFLYFNSIFAKRVHFFELPNLVFSYIVVVIVPRTVAE